MALNEKTKDKFRRVIRGLMVGLAAVLLVLGLGVPVVNNALAIGVSKEVAAFPLPQNTTVEECSSLAGRFTNVRGSMQYVGAVLLKSERSLAELRMHYAQYDKNIMEAYYVEPMNENTLHVADGVTMNFRTALNGHDYYAVYTIRTGGHAMQWWLDMDVRG